MVYFVAAILESITKADWVISTWSVPRQALLCIEKVTLTIDGQGLHDELGKGDKETQEKQEGCTKAERV